MRDLRLVPVVFELLDIRCTRAAARGLMLRLNVIHADVRGAEPAAALTDESDG